MLSQAVREFRQVKTSSSRDGSASEDPGFMAGRIRTLAAVGAICFTVAAMALAIRSGTHGRLDRLGHPGFVGLILGGLSITPALFARRLGRNSLRRLNWLETISTVVTFTCFTPVTHFAEAMMRERLVLRFGVQPGHDLLLREYGVLAAVFSSSIILALRSALVPSTGWRTLFIHLLVSVPLLSVAGYGWLPWGDSIQLQRADRIAVTTGAISWWLRGTLVCVALSVITHRLRREVRKAKALGQYFLEERLGSGGMGSVYRARHAFLKRTMAIKLLDCPPTDAIAVGRFEREARLTAGLSHPNTIDVYDFGQTPDGQFYYAMELLDGLDLLNLVENYGPQPPERVIHVLECVCGSLHEAHLAGLVHRDVKPANVFLCRDYGGVTDFVKVLDFGLVRETSDESTHVTLSGTVPGTPMYMAPEVLRNVPATTPQSDLYAVGALGYYLLCGKEVFEFNSMAEIISAQLNTLPAPPSSQLQTPPPKELERLIMACLEKDLTKRPQTAAELADAMTALKVRFPWTLEQRAQWWHAHQPDSQRQPRGNTAPTLILSPERAASGANERPL